MIRSLVSRAFHLSVSAIASLAVAELRQERLARAALECELQCAQTENEALRGILGMRVVSYGQGSFQGRAS